MNLITGLLINIKNTSQKLCGSSWNLKQQFSNGHAHKASTHTVIAIQSWLSLVYTLFLHVSIFSVDCVVNSKLSSRVENIYSCRQEILLDNKSIMTKKWLTQQALTQLPRLLVNMMSMLNRNPASEIDSMAERLDRLSRKYANRVRFLATLSLYYSWSKCEPRLLLFSALTNSVKFRSSDQWPAIRQYNTKKKN